MDDLSGRPTDFTETERLKAVHALELLDTPPEQAYDEIVQLAQYLTQANICVISLLDTNRYWLKAKVGTPLREVPRGVASGLDTVITRQFVEVEDLSLLPGDDLHPLAEYPLNMRFYASYPLYTKYGIAVGTLSVMDDTPRRLNEAQKSALQTLANQVSTLFTLRTTQQELRHLTDSQQRILAITGHDIKSPLTALQMVLEMRCSGEMSEAEILEVYPMLSNQLKSALRLINNLVQWGQLVVQRGARYVIAFYLHQEVAHCLEELKERADQKGITLVNEVPESELVRADPYATAFILRNLVGNAIKFTNRGSIIVSFERHEKGAWLHVSDTGIGMTPQMALQLQRQAAGQQRKGTAGEDGSGLGLALVADYVRSVNGQLLIASEEGVGTTVSVEI